MAGIYLHIPFCKQACSYCNFHFTTSLRYKDDLVDAMLTEIRREQLYLEQQLVETIYFGGGTPSLLPTADIERILATIHKSYRVSAGAEITLEANPDDITRDRLQEWKDAGINRLSIGVQSFFEEELRWMNRAHNVKQARQCIEWTLTRGFSNITIDLIYGSPLLTDSMWKQNVDLALEYEIPHLSCYALTVEEKTPLHKQITQARKQPVDNERQASQFLLLMQWLRAAGYEHYEVSNFAKPGFRSRHNTSYWKGIPYLGIGPSAHSFNGMERRWNLPNNTAYIRGMMEGQPARNAEQLSDRDRMNEFIMISMRTMEGLDMQQLEARFGSAAARRVESAAVRYISNGQLMLADHALRLTDTGM
ncbi:MAG TPA: radical SAM family heme chaperone HemW, partial [Flavisolibacter sp.]